MKKYLIWLNLLFFLGFGGTVPGLVLASQRTDIVTSAGSGGGPHILRFSADGSRTLSNFFAYDNEYRSWTSIASGDIDGDREPEIVVGPGINHAGQVKIFQLDGTLKLVDFYPFGEQHTQGINVAVGDVDGDFIDELIFGSATESQAWIKIYKYSDEKLVLTQFMAYASNFRGGVYVAAGDVDGDDKDEVITGAGFGGGPHVRVFNIENGRVYPEAISFFPFHQNYHYGVRVATGDVDGDGKDEIISGQASSQAWVKTYNFDSGRTVVSNFLAYAPNFYGGVRIASGDIDNDGVDEIITGVGPGGGPHIRTFKGDGRLRSANFFAYNEQFRGGVNIAATNVKKLPTCKNGCREARVAGIEDGDTVFLQGGEAVRYIGVNTPEPGRQYSREATVANERLVFEKKITLEFDSGDLDPYGRTLAYVFADDVFVNYELIKQGWAGVTIYPPDTKYAALFRKAEEIARLEKKGIWQ